jgi:hypothetical protein
MVDFEHAQAIVRIAIREGVQSGTENDELIESAGDRIAELIFHQTAACRDECTQSTIEGCPIDVRWISGQRARVLRADHSHRQWIVEHDRFVE